MNVFLINLRSISLKKEVWKSKSGVYMISANWSETDWVWEEERVNTGHTYSQKYHLSVK